MLSLRNLITFVIFIGCNGGAVASGEKKCDRLLLSLSPGLEFHLAKENTSFREESGAKEWTTEEKAQVEKSLTDFFQASNLTHFFERIAANGFDTIYRFSHPTEFSFLTDRYEALKESKIAAMTLSDRHAIEIYDRYFKKAPYADPTLGYGSPEYILMHELVHAFDVDHVSIGPEFIQLVGWEEVEVAESFLGPAFGWRLKNVNLDEMKLVEQTVQGFWDQGNYEGSLRIEREFAHRHGMPSLYAMKNPKECLAEIAAHIVFDKTAEQYLTRHVVNWVKSHVLR